MNALVRPQAGELRESEAQRSGVQDYELTRLALLTGAAEVLARSAAGALRYLESGFDYRRAADLAKQATALLDAAGIEVPLPLLRTAADRLQAVGEVAPAEALRQRALEAIEQGATVSGSDQGLLMLQHARALVARGELDAALPFFEEAHALAPTDRERAIVQGDIADILQARGELDEALRIRTEEQLPVYERLRDQRELSHTLWSMAQIEMRQEKHQDAYEHLARSYDILLKLGVLDGICIVGLDLGQLLCQAGHRDEGLTILRRSEEGFRRLQQHAQAEQTAELIRSMEGA